MLQYPERQSPASSQGLPRIPSRQSIPSDEPTHLFEEHCASVLQGWPTERRGAGVGAVLRRLGEEDGAEEVLGLVEGEVLGSLDAEGCPEGALLGSEGVEGVEDGALLG